MNHSEETFWCQRLLLSLKYFEGYDWTVTKLVRLTKANASSHTCYPKMTLLVNSLPLRAILASCSLMATGSVYLLYYCIFAFRPKCAWFVGECARGCTIGNCLLTATATTWSVRLPKGWCALWRDSVDAMPATWLQFGPFTGCCQCLAIIGSHQKVPPAIPTPPSETWRILRLS